MAVLRTQATLLAGVMLLGIGLRSHAQQTAPPPASATPPDYQQLSDEARRASEAKDKQAAQAAGASTPATTSDQQPAAAGAAPAAATDAAAKPDEAAAPAAGVSPAPLTKVSGKSKKKVKPEKPVIMSIVRGELTVDGLIAKADLNYQIVGLRYLYIWVPGLGTTVISNDFFPGSKFQPDAIDGSTLTVKVDGRQLQLACEYPLIGGIPKGEMSGKPSKADKADTKDKKDKKKDKPIGVFVMLDREYQKPSIYPQFGYGTTLKAPYDWPATLADLNPNPKAPPLPENLRQPVAKVKHCTTNPDGTQNCTYTDVPLVLGKNGKS